MKISSKEFNNIKEGKQVYIVSDDNSYDNKDIVLLESNDDTLEVEITIKYKYNSLDDCFNLLPFDLFGFNSLEEALEYYKNINEIIVYRIKVDNDRKLEDNLDDEILDLIDISSIVKNNVGHSASEVYELKLKDGTEAILKVQYLSSRNDLKSEYERNKWLEGKLNVPKVFCFKEINKVQYYLREKSIGISAHKVEDFAPLVGENLKEIHSVDISDCPFNNNDTLKLLDIALSKIDIILPNIIELYPDMNKESIIEFLKNKRPIDRVLVHGDYSLPNILVDEDRNVSLIDLGDASISTKYFDLYYLRKSFNRNKKMDYFNEFLESYGLSSLDDDSMKWMDIIDKVLF